MEGMLENTVSIEISEERYSSKIDFLVERIFSHMSVYTNFLLKGDDLHGFDTNVENPTLNGSLFPLLLALAVSEAPIGVIGLQKNLEDTT